MWELHSFIETKRQELPPLKEGGAVSAQSLFACLYEICEESQKAPSVFRIPETEPETLYVLFNEAGFVEDEFWTAFGSVLGALSSRWQIDLFSTEPFVGETVWMKIEEQDGTLYEIEKTVSGKPAETLQGLCLRIQCETPEESSNLQALLDGADWDNGVTAVMWEYGGFLETEEISLKLQNTCVCYGSVFVHVEPSKLLCTLRFPQKVFLWKEYLRTGFDYGEFEWMYQAIAENVLGNRIEWELALHEAIRGLKFSIRIAPQGFELYDGQGNRRYFSADSGWYGEKALLKILFPLNL